jgi:hypothetical protein
MLAASCAIAKQMNQYLVRGVCYAALKQPSPVNMAQAMRAVLFARAIAATLTWRRSMTFLIDRSAAIAKANC